MLDEIAAVLEDVDRALAGVDVDAMVADQPARALSVLGRHERAVAACRARLTARAEQMRQWQREGYDSFEDWYAATQGTSKGRARRRAASARKMKDRPATAEALGKGEISEEQAETIADAADKNPGAEEELLGTARNMARTHKELRDQAARAKASAEDDTARAERLRDGRTAGWGGDRDGFWSGFTKQQPHVGAEMQRRLEAETERRFRAARKAGIRAGRDQYRADALAALILGADPETGDPATTCDPMAAQPAASDEAGPPEGRARPAAQEPVPKSLVLDIDLAAYRRHHTLSGETCEIRGVGPVPVEVARQWSDDAFIKAVIRDGTEIRTVVHFGRNIPERLRTALEFRDRFCVVPHCSTARIEWDHHHPYADQGPCSTANLRGACMHHHRQITHDGFKLEGGPGHWKWIGPDGDVLAADDPADLPREANAP